MAEKPVVFDQQSAQRISRVVQSVEMGLANRAAGNRIPPARLQKHLFARITGTGTLADGQYPHAWTEIQRTETGWEDAPDGRTGTATSRAAIYPLSLSGSPRVVLFEDATTNPDPDDDRMVYTALPMTEGMDLLNGGTVIVSLSPLMNIPTNRGTLNLLEFASATVNGTDGGNLQFKAGSANYQTMLWNGSAWTIDYPRGHS